ncbi:MAG: DUF1640 domain-containing protein [Halochromatium sp.]|nr:DUF1640 domain-containing protein [Halochromatium sp.]
MSVTAFDTHRFIQTLRRANLSEEQAEAIAEAFREAIGEEIVTKDDLRAEIESAKGDLIKWIAGLLLAQAVLVSALVKLL